ncbi:MAG: DUF1289 domain-containing protein [Proteobacteria bacterium]|nr:DUF1289 domain-containing protein [Pseudomonadota bacterium]
MTTSPCIGVCRLDHATQLCLGCKRSIEEIAAWPDLPEAERQAILAKLRQRPAAGDRAART